MKRAYKVNTYRDKYVLAKFQNKTGGFHSEVSRNPNGGYFVMEYVGNISFPAIPPKWKKFKIKNNAIMEAKRYVRS